MKRNMLNRTIVAAGIGAIALVGSSVVTRADSPPPQNQQQPAAQKEKPPKKAKPPEQQKGRSEAAHQQQQLKRLNKEDQLVRIQQQEHRTMQYRAFLDQQQRVAQQHAAQLQQQNRRAQIVFQQQYAAGLHQQQVRLERQGQYNYGNDPYFYTPSSYRYMRGGRSYETNQYGADLLRQAVTYGYDQGVRAGQADRQDRWTFNYQNSYAYQDANLGYAGFYVDRDDYNAYFRDGFRRGYEDGYNSRYVSGRYVNGKGTILDAILGAILSFESIH